MLDTTASMIQYRGDGGRSVFPIPFPFLENSHIRAHIRDSAGGTRPLAAGVDYIINRASGADGASGGEFVLAAGNLPAGHLLTIRRLLPVTQEIFFHNQGPNSPRAIEEAVDRLTMISQQLRDGIDTCLRAPDAETAAELSESAAEAAVRIAAVENALAGKAAANHAHGMAELPGLSAALAGKADAAATTQALAGKASASALAGKADIAAVAAKADRAELALKADVSALASKADVSALAAKADASALAAKADTVHRHMIDEVDGVGSVVASLDQKIALKLDADDPRLDAIGNGGGGGTTDHAELLNRDAADQHPQSAVTNLASDLDGIRKNISTLLLTDGALGDRLESVETAAAEIPPISVRVADAETDLAGLQSDVAAAENSIAAFAGQIAEIDGRVRDVAAAALDEAAAAQEFADNVQAAVQAGDAVGSAMARVADQIAALGEMALASDVPVDGKQYVRKNRAWAEVLVPVNPPAGGGSGGGGNAGGSFVGDIRLLPFRHDALPGGWYFCNGAAVPLEGPQGQALAALPESFRIDWGITADADAGTITLPNLFDAETGSGLFPRGVDGTARLPGSVQSDAIRNITARYGDAGGFALVKLKATSPYTTTVLGGAFTQAEKPDKTMGPGTMTLGYNGGSDLIFDASLVVPTAEENRPVNIGMTPAIYLGA